VDDRSPWGLVVVCALAAGGCGRTEAPIDGRAILLPYAAHLGDAVSVEQTTWFVVAFEYSSALLCRLDSLALRCAPIPATDDRGAHLVEPAPGATPLVAVPADAGVRYLDPFTWRQVRQLPDVSFEQHAVVLPDATLWIEESSNLLVVPPTEPPRRWFATPNHVGRVSLAPSGAIWVAYRGPEPAKRVVSSAPLGSTGLGPVREHPGVGRWALRACRVGTTVGLIDLYDGDLVMLDLETGDIQRHAGYGGYVQCRPGTVAAAPLHLQAGEPEPPAVWCSRDGCRTAEVQAPGMSGVGAFAVIDRGLLAVGSFENHLAAWRLGDPPHHLHVTETRFLELPATTPVPDGTLVVFRSGELLVLDQDGRPRPIAFRWSGPALLPSMGGT